MILPFLEKARTCGRATNFTTHSEIGRYPVRPRFRVIPIFPLYVREQTHIESRFESHKTTKHTDGPACSRRAAYHSAAPCRPGRFVDLPGKAATSGSE